MAWGIVAIALLGLIGISRGVGLSALEAKWAQEDGRATLARMIRVRTALLWGGSALLVLGSIWGQSWLKWLGVALMATPVLGEMWSLIHKEQRRRSAPR